MQRSFRFKALFASFIVLGMTTAGSAAAISGDDGVTGKARFLPGKQTSETIAARQHFFGIDNVNPRTGAVRTDRVIMSWMGVSTFAASFNGHVVMLDGYLAYGRNGTWGSSKEYIGTSPEEYAAINPEVYLFGHGHSDHMG